MTRCRHGAGGKKKIGWETHCTVKKKNTVILGGFARPIPRYTCHIPFATCLQAVVGTPFFFSSVGGGRGGVLFLFLCERHCGGGADACALYPEQICQNFYVSSLEPPHYCRATSININIDGSYRTVSWSLQPFCKVDVTLEQPELRLTLHDMK